MEVAKPIKQNLIQVMMNDSQIQNIIILNIIKMLYSRQIIDESHIDMYSSLAQSRIDQNDETWFELSDDETNKIGSNIIRIKFILNRKITTIKKVIDIETFMGQTDYKFVIVQNITPKAVKQIKDYKNTELFYADEQKINLIDHILVPKHIKLNILEREQFIESYKLSEKNLPRICIDDPISRYYNLSVGDIVRIERPSLTSGISISYRIVYNNSIYK
jgi:DNA-directed RNA polymerase subunit H (RpoH/RPB5)